MMTLVRIVAPHFVAGFETDGVVRRAAPILRYMVGWSDDCARSYIAAKGWKASRIDQVAQPGLAPVSFAGTPALQKRPTSAGPAHTV